MLENFELESLDEVHKNGTDFDYEIEHIVDYRIYQKTSKEQYNTCQMDTNQRLTLGKIPH